MVADIYKAWSKRIGAVETYFLPTNHGLLEWINPTRTWMSQIADEIEAQLQTEPLLADTLFVQTLGSTPLFCPNLKKVSQYARAHRRILLADNTLATSFGAAASRFGADITLESLAHVAGQSASDLIAVSFSQNFCRTHEEFCSQLADLSNTQFSSYLSHKKPSFLEELSKILDNFLLYQRRQNDTAQSIACYLACHPRVSHVFYPGLLFNQDHPAQKDKRNSAAPAMLSFGFGPCIDFQRTESTDIERICATDEPIRQQILALEAQL